MATQPTQNAVPSESPRDLKFNAGKIDEYVTSMGWTYTDRFEVKHYTVEGINYLAQQAMNDFGYITLNGVSFTTGATVSTPNEVLLNTADSQYYKWTGSFASGGKVVPANSTPANSGGIGPGLWLAVGDASVKSYVDAFIAALASTEYGKGDALVAVKSVLPGGVARTQHDKNADAVSAYDLGVIGDGVTDDSDALQAALNSLATIAKNVTLYGGTLKIPYNARIKVTKNISVPGGVNIIGESGIGVPSTANWSGRSSSRSSTLALSGDGMLTLGGGNYLCNISLIGANITSVQNNAVNFAGTALTGVGEDIYLDNVAIMGFNRAFTSSNSGRQTFNRCKIDCVNGIRILGSYDVARITNCHIYPFLTVASTAPITTADDNHYLYRTGQAIEITGASWPWITGTFIYGYNNGILLTDVANAQVNNCGTESVRIGPVMLGATGINVTGSSSDACISNSVFAHHNQCVYLTSVANTHHVLNGVLTRDGASTGIAIVTGSATLTNCSTVGYDAASSVGVKVITTEEVIIEAHHTRNEAVGIDVRTNNCTVGNVSKIGTVTAVTYLSTPRTIASAARLPITAASNTWIVTGTTGVSSMAETKSGHLVSIWFRDPIVLTGNSGVAGGLKVSGGSLSVLAGQVVQFYAQGATGSTVWYQVGPPVTY